MAMRPIWIAAAVLAEAVLIRKFVVIILIVLARIATWAPSHIDALVLLMVSKTAMKLVLTEVEPQPASTLRHAKSEKCAGLITTAPLAYVLNKSFAVN
jgi:hypothetical protein